MAAKTEATSRLLVLCVDRDNDIGIKAGVATPVVGRDKCILAATKLAMADPEEADANAVFAAVKELDELVARRLECEVAVVAGMFERGVEGDQKIGREIRKVLELFRAEGVVLISDGVEDEQILPILQGILPVISVKRIVIKHSRSVEESYAVLARYARMLIYDTRYSRYFLGVPGLLLTIIGILVILGKVTEAMAVSLAIIGLALIVRGFDLDRLASSITRLKPSGYIRLFSVAASVLIVIAAFYQGFTGIALTEQYKQLAADPNLIWAYGAFLLGVFIRESVNMIWIALGLYFGGMFLYYWIRKSFKMLRSAVGILMLVLLYLPMLQFSLILMGSGSPVTLISFLLIGLAVVFLAVTLAYQYLAQRRSLG